MEGRNKQAGLIGPEDNQLWSVDTFGGLQLLRASYAAFSFAPHTHDEFMIAVTEDGAALPQFRGGGYLHLSGDILVLNPGEVHGGGPVQGAIWRYRSFYLPPGLLRCALEELDGCASGLPQFNENVIHDSFVWTRLHQAHKAFDVPSSELEREGCLLEALAGLVARHAVERLPARRIGHEHQAVQIARAYLESLPGENVPLSRLAQESCLSPYYLCRVFRQETGLTLHAYQTLVRVQLAKRLLVQGLPIAQVAIDTGFYDQAHLTRHFKRIYGVTPGQVHHQ